MAASSPWTARGTRRWCSTPSPCTGGVWARRGRPPWPSSKSRIALPRADRTSSRAARRRKPRPAARCTLGSLRLAARPDVRSAYQDPDALAERRERQDGELDVLEREGDPD